MKIIGPLNTRILGHADFHNLLKNVTQSYNVTKWERAFSSNQSRISYEDELIPRLVPVDCKIWI